MTLRQLCDESRQRLASHFSQGEARWMVRIIMEELKGYTLSDLALKGDDEVSEYLIEKTRAVVDRLLSDEPLQYIFGHTRFYGMRFNVTPDTLIPRPETEELVDMIVKEYSRCNDLRVLDACTGSGCIAVALALNLPFSRVDAFDVSQGALEVARENAKSLNASRVDIFNADALKIHSEPTPLYDIIVSNPPYIAEHERTAMEPNVLLHEPHSALFVPDDDPLKFYTAISRYALTALKPGGTLWFEINPLYASQLQCMLRGEGWEDVATMRDSGGKNRFLTAKRAES